MRIAEENEVAPHALAEPRRAQTPNPRPETPNPKTRRARPAHPSSPPFHPAHPSSMWWSSMSLMPSRVSEETHMQAAIPQPGIPM